MTLTVRLDPALESALEQYCAEHGVTKSLVAQQSLATYLASASGLGSRAARGGRGRVSAAYRAFQQAGLIGAVALGGESATNDVVRRRIVEHLKQKARSRSRVRTA